MTRCVAFKCNNVGIYRFPTNPNRRKLWETCLKRKKNKATDSSRLCSSHFKPEDYYGKSVYTVTFQEINLLQNFCGVLLYQVYSLVSFTVPETPLARERHARLEKRCQRKLEFTSTQAPSTSELTFPIYADVSNEIDVNTITDSVHVTQNSRFVEKGTQLNVEHVCGCINRFKDDNNAIAFYTGFESYKKFHFVFSTLSPMANKIVYYGSSVINLSTEDQFFLTMMKLRQDKCNFELSRFFAISTTTVSNIFITWINFIHQAWKKLHIWPEKDLVKYYMPNCFKQYNSNTREILDGTEIRVQKPENPLSQQASWSSYKHTNTLKILVGATPGGLLSYCPEAYAGSVSDRQTVERSDISQKCESGDCILADRGFNIQDMFADKDVTVNIPSFLKGKSQIPGLIVLHDRKLASKRVHIERLIGLMKTYKIMKNELHHSYIPLASKIFFTCFMSCNFRETIMYK